MTILEEGMIRRLIDLELRIETAARQLDRLECETARYADETRERVRPWLELPAGDMEVEA